jgi:hypothetical protein
MTMHLYYNLILNKYNAPASPENFYVEMVHKAKTEGLYVVCRAYVGQRYSEHSKCV